MLLKCGCYEVDLSRPQIMGIVNTTPDSFSDGGAWDSPQRAIDHAYKLLEEGATILDIGGESTRPGSEEVAIDVELARVLPVLEALVKCGVPISIDTRKPEVMSAAIEAGAHMINDISGMQTIAAIQAVADSDVAVCVMHMKGSPKVMQIAPHYDDVVEEVGDFLMGQAKKLEDLGIDRQRIVLDPGFGFGKTLEQNYELLDGLQVVIPDPYVRLVGMSRKSMIGGLTGKPPHDRLAGSLALALAAYQRDAHIIRVHDVAATVEALEIWQYIEYTPYRKGLM